MKYCGSCGSEFPEGARFCVQCGQARPGVTTTGSDVSAGATAMPPVPAAGPAPPTQAAMPEQPQVIVTSTKSVGVAVLLAVLFGPLGMLYATVPGALIMVAVAIVVGALTFGLGLFLVWPACMIWGGVAAKAHNEKLLSGRKRY